MKISMIAAMGTNRVIGRGGDLPWHIPEDLKFFKRTTKGHAIIMGRKTFDSIGKRPLPHRENIVLTRQRDYEVPEGVRVFASLEESLDYLREKGDEDEAFIVGGSEIYRQGLEHADRIYLTEIEQSFDGDTFFPEFSKDDFREVSREPASHDQIHFAWVTYEK